eukprot:CAMPEP_0180295388 /NCGR_PEP_ID=MMETSP0988-20121125/18930_1 /TAXON_ID=697907 /ORGANISM="non described non described, Strain CCMP2293" /LENGTH=64 /DNA_ID=CAMNT_0022272879 /DNA_START=67 /DNA_END=258 /DNA_ORIENTATION=-
MGNVLKTGWFSLRYRGQEISHVNVWPGPSLGMARADTDNPVYMKRNHENGLARQAATTGVTTWG